MLTPSDFVTISHLALQARSLKESLEQFVRLIRAAVIFDNFVVYKINQGDGSLDVVYAKSLGRGKSAEADVSWGDVLAAQVVEKKAQVLQQPASNEQTDRLNNPFLLGLPVQSGANLLGVCVFIRYGGPLFADSEIELLSFIADEIAWLIQKENTQFTLEEMQARFQTYQLQEDFIHTLTHELRSPLGFIKGYATTLLRSDTEWNTATQKEFLEIIDNETDQLEELIENLLDSARLQSGQFQFSFQPIRIEAVLNDVIQRSQINRPALEFQTKFAIDLPAIQGDPRRLAQVFENLINNAIKYAPHSKIDIEISSKSNGVQVLFQDHGHGIPEKYLPFVFDRFFRNPEESVSIHGSGLGLYICRQIIQAHQGKITVQSILKKGTKFIIFLPKKTDTHPMAESKGVI